MFLLRLRTTVVMKIASTDDESPVGARRAHLRHPDRGPARGVRPRLAGAEHIKRALFKPRELCWELGVLNERWAPLWKRLGIYAPQGSPV